MLISEVIQRIQSLYSKGVESDDSRLVPRRIYNKALTVRSKLISQQAKKKQKISQWDYQTIPCVKLIEAPIHECPCVPPIGCSIYRSEEPLPNPMSDLNRHLIQSVSSLDGKIFFGEIMWSEVKYKYANRYTANKPDYFIKNNYLYITHKKNVPVVVSVTGLWEDPVSVYNFASLCDNAFTEDSCVSPLDMEFPMSSDMIDTLIEMAVQELIMVFGRVPEDLTNNGKDSRYVIESNKDK